MNKTMTENKRICEVIKKRHTGNDSDYSKAVLLVVEACESCGYIAEPYEYFRAWEIALKESWKEERLQ